MNKTFAQKGDNSIWSYPSENTCGCQCKGGLDDKQTSSFFDESSIHGLKYLGQANRCRMRRCWKYFIIILLSCWQARIFWAAATSVAFMCGVYLIYQASMLAGLLIFIPVFLLQVFAKSVASPVLVSFASEPTPIWEIPFPALTVCNMNKVRI